MIVIVVKPYVGFPEGTAATSRVTAYARGLAAAGRDVHVILLGPSELDGADAANPAVRGVHLGIPYEYTSVSTVKHRSLPVRRWRVLTSLLNARRRIRELAAESGVEAVLLYAGTVTTAALIGSASRSIGAAYAVDLVEMPLHEMRAGAARDVAQSVFGRLFLGRFDLVVSISDYLSAYAAKYLRTGAMALRLPIMVDCDAYDADVAPSPSPRFVTYAGMLTERKDGVGTLIEAFSRIAAEFPDVVLRLVGDSNDARVSNIGRFRELAAGHGVADRVEFAGQVRRADVAGFLTSSSLLVLARPSSQQADAGFPTKLGEYLASGRPVVVTRTSDIAGYLVDGESAYLVPPGDVTELAARLRQALADPERSAAIGVAGRRVAETTFDYRVCGRTFAAALDRVAQASA